MEFQRKRRQAVQLSADNLVEQRHFEDTSLPLVYEAAVEGLELTPWVARNHERLREQLDRHGGVLLRGFAATLESFAEAVAAVAGTLVDYTERSSPRSQVGGRIYTSTDYPPSYPIFLHNEQSYNLVFPGIIAFHCVVSAREGGATPLADSRKVHARIDLEVRRRFVEQGYRYVRNFGDGLGLTWQQAFQTEDPSAVERYCRANGIDFQWNATAFSSTPRFTSTCGRTKYPCRFP